MSRRHNDAVSVTIAASFRQVVLVASSASSITSFSENERMTDVNHAYIIVLDHLPLPIILFYLQSP
jgi:hypothetical protein